MFVVVVDLEIPTLCYLQISYINKQEWKESVETCSLCLPAGRPMYSIHAKKCSFIVFKNV